MSKFFSIIVFICLTVCVNSQTVIHLDTIGKQHTLKTNFNQPLFSDSISSSFCILIPNEVKAHKHMYHSEQVYVLDGEGTMKLGNKSFVIKKGDLVFIPKNTVHSVQCNSAKPLKVISVQSPYFDGTDRVLVEE